MEKGRGSAIKVILKRRRRGTDRYVRVRKREANRQTQAHRQKETN